MLGTSLVLPQEVFIKKTRIVALMNQQEAFSAKRFEVCSEPTTNNTKHTSHCALSTLVGLSPVALIAVPCILISPLGARCGPAAAPMAPMVWWITEAFWTDTDPNLLTLLCLRVV